MEKLNERDEMIRYMYYERILTRNDGFTEQVPVPTGIRQGNSMSLILFNFILVKIIDSVKEAITILYYADDASLIADNENDLQ
ncbi:hypothetical protein Trydic_g14607 [Trypoxylus dichotomus]